MILLIHFNSLEVLDNCSDNNGCFYLFICMFFHNLKCYQWALKEDDSW